MSFFAAQMKKMCQYNSFQSRDERRMKSPAIPLIWNDDGILLDTHGTNGDHSFENFTGHILCFRTECSVQNATFIFHAGDMAYLAGEKPAFGFPGCPEQNWIQWRSGILLSGHLNCRCWENGTVEGGELNCTEYESGTVNGGKVTCSVWGSGTVNGGEICCHEWECGTFNAGILQGNSEEDVKWKDGIFNGGTFTGKWYGGIWNGGTFQGKVRVGDGTFEWIANGRKQA